MIDDWEEGIEVELEGQKGNMASFLERALNMIPEANRGETFVSSLARLHDWSS